MTARPRPLRLLCIGQSHFHCVRSAAAAAADTLAAEGIEVTTVVMNDARYEPHFVAAPGGTETLHPALRADIDAALGSADAVYLSVGGTAHWVLGLVEHPRPFDFVLEDEPQTPLDPTREAVPAALVRGALEASRLFVHQRALRAHLAAHLPRPLAQLESPPPAPESHLRRHPGRYAELVAERGIAPAPLRRKLWRLHSRLVAEQGEALGLGHIGVPAAAVRADGHLVPQALDDDPTHASAWYGRRVIEQLVGRHRPGFRFVEAAA